MKPIGWIDRGTSASLYLFALVLIAPALCQQQRPTRRPEPTLPPVVPKFEPIVIEEEEEVSNKTKIVLTGNPQIDYIHDPNLPIEVQGFDLSEYPFYKRVPNNIDETNFTCDGRFDGFYASVPHKCQVYHNCLFGIKYNFLCPNYTAFDQANLICHYYSVVDCERSPQYFHRNENLYIDPTTTTAAPEVRIVYIERPHPRKRPSERVRPNRRRPPPPQEDDYYYDYVDDTQPAVKSKPQQTNTVNEDYYYYYDDDLPVATTTRRPAVRRRPLRTRTRGRRPQQAAIQRDRFVEEIAPEEEPPRKKVPDRIVGELTREELGLPPTEAPPRREVPTRAAGKLTDAELGISQQNAPKRRRPQRRRRKKTTTTTAAPEYYDEYYDYYEDEPVTTTTTTTARPAVRRRKGPAIRRPRPRPSTEDRRQALLRARDNNPTFPGDLDIQETAGTVSEPIDVEQSEPSGGENIQTADETFSNRSPNERLDLFPDEDPPPRLGQRRPGEPAPESSIFTTNDRVIAEDQPVRRQGSFRRPSNSRRRPTIQLSK